MSKRPSERDDTERASLPVSDCIDHFEMTDVDAASMETVTPTGTTGVVMARMIHGLTVGERSSQVDLNDEPMQESRSGYTDVSLRLGTPRCRQETVSVEFSRSESKSDPLLRSLGPLASTSRSVTKVDDALVAPIGPPILQTTAYRTLVISHARQSSMMGA